MNGNILKQIRITSKLSQKEFAKKLGLSQTFVSLMENERYPVSDSTKRKVIAANFDVSREILDQIDRLHKLNA